jgi:hypothetical protein
LFGSVAASSFTVNSNTTITATAPAESVGTVDVTVYNASTSATSAADRYTVDAPPTVSKSASASPSPVTGTSTNLSVLGAYVGGEANLTYTWSTTGPPPAPVTFSVDGTNAAKNSTAIFTKAGVYAFQVTITDPGGLSTSSSVSVTVAQTLTSVTVSPASVSLALGGTEQLTAQGLDQFGAPMAAQPSFIWSVVSGGGTVSSTGLYTAPTTLGTAQVQASSGGVSGIAQAVTNSGTVWLDDAAPAGAVLSSDGGDSWTWAATNPAPYSGTLDLQSSLASGEHQLDFYDYSSTITVPAGGSLFAHVYLDPANPPSEVMLQWNVGGSWEHRAYWGADDITWGNDGTISRASMGALPATGGWVQLAVPASVVGLDGQTLIGMAFTLYGGRAAWDDVGVSAPPTSASTVWVDDAYPAGAASGSDGGPSWTWAASNPAPSTGSLDLQAPVAPGEHQAYFYNTWNPLSIPGGSSLFAYVYLDPANPPSEVMLQWNVGGSWEHRAYWGADDITWGSDGTVSRASMGALPATGGWVQLAVPASVVGLDGQTVNGMAFTLYNGRASFDDAGVAPPSSALGWVDDAAPAGASLFSNGGDSWTWSATDPTPYSGALDLQSSLASGVHQLYFQNATQTLTIPVGGTLFAYVYLNPANPPQEVMLQWYNGSWEHRAYWGADDLLWGTDGTASRYFMGALPATGSWVRLSVPASLVGLDGQTINGMAFTLYGGQADWDDAGENT